MKRGICASIAVLGLIFTLGFVGNMEISEGNDMFNFVGALTSLIVSFVCVQVGELKAR